MRKKVLIDFLSSFVLLILSSFIILLPLFGVSDVKTVLSIVFGSIALLKLVQFIFIFKDKDYESLGTFFVSLGAFIWTRVSDLDVKNLVLLLLVFIAFMSLLKLKKADFYHDRKNKMWILRLFILFVFLMNGLLISLNLQHEGIVQIIMIGNFLFVSSILDMIDPIVIYLMENRK